MNRQKIYAFVSNFCTTDDGWLLAGFGTKEQKYFYYRESEKVRLVPTNQIMFLYSE